MFAIAMCFLLGVLWCLQLAALPPPLILWLLPPVLWLFTCSYYSRLLASVLAGFLWAVFCAQQIDKERLAPALEGQTLALCGTINALPLHEGHRSRFDLAVDSASLHDKPIAPFPAKVRLSWYRPTAGLQAGQGVCLAARLKRPYGFMNPGGFDYERWLYQHGIRAVGYVRTSQPVGIRRPAAAYDYHAWREQIRQRLSQQGVSPLVPALALGDRSGMSEADWQTLQATGTGHLLAISGLHIGLLAACGFFLGRWLWAVTLLPVIKIPAQHVGALVALLMATGYAALAGFSLPTQRALLMLAAVLLAVLGRRRIASFDVYGLALLAVLVHDPFAPLSYSFWLSFTAVLIILLINIDRANRPGRLRLWLKLQYGIGLGLLPALLALFGQLPSMSIPANLLAIPWVSLITVPTALLGTAASMLDLAVAQYVFMLCDASIAAFWLVMRLLAGLPFAQVQPPYLPLLVKICAAAAVIILLAPRGLLPAWLCVFLLLPLLAYRPAKPVGDAMRLTVFDVGQGLAALIETETHTLLYDSGPAFSPDFNAGKAVIVPYLRHRGIHHLDVIVQSHGDIDHIGGLYAILNVVSVGRIYSSVPQGIPGAQACHAGQGWRWDGISFTLLHPRRASSFKGNNASCVLAVANAAYRILLPGDIEKTAERTLLANHYDALDADILLAPHHGSASSSSPAFVRATRPDFVVFTVGYRNRFGLPKQRIIQRYRAAGAKVLFTYLDGAVTFSIPASMAGQGIAWSGQRHRQRRFWHTRPSRP